MTRCEWIALAIANRQVYFQERYPNVSDEVIDEYENIADILVSRGILEPDEPRSEWPKMRPMSEYNEDTHGPALFLSDNGCFYCSNYAPSSGLFASVGFWPLPKEEDGK